MYPLGSVGVEEQKLRQEERSHINPFAAQDVVSLT